MTDIRIGNVRVALAVTAILALVMTACGGGSSPTTSTAVSDGSPPPTGSPSSSPSVEAGPMMFPPTGQVLTGGTYRSVMTDPSVTMTLPGTWLVFGQTSNFVNAQIGTTATMKEFYVFKFDGRLVDPKDNKTIVQTDDLIDSLRANAHVRFLDAAEAGHRRRCPRRGVRPRSRPRPCLRVLQRWDLLLEPLPHGRGQSLLAHGDG